jgi:allantoate deiminase
VEECGVIATVGVVEARPGATNVIPGEAEVSLDARDLSDARRVRAVDKLQRIARKIAAKRGLRLRWEIVQESGTVACDPALTRLMMSSVAKQQARAISLPSGAGHDAVAVAALCPVAMLFVRCKGGLSHHPAESVKTADVGAAIAAMHDFVLQLAARHA